MQLMMLSQTIFQTYMGDMRHYRLNWHRLLTVYHPHNRQQNMCDMGNGNRVVSGMALMVKLKLEHTLVQNVL